MIIKLVALLKKDVILATRSIIWTMFELLLPVCILFMVNGMMTTFNDVMVDQVKKGGGEKLLDSFVIDMTTPIFFMSPEGLCDLKKVPSQILIKEGDKVTKQYIDGKWYNETGITMDKTGIEKEMADCKMAILMSHVTGKDITLYVPISAQKMPKEEWKSPTELAAETYMFVGIIPQTMGQIADPTKLGQGHTRSFKIEKIKLRKIEIPEQALPYFFAIIGASMSVTVINLVRTVVTEKATVKPYLSAIGLPSWLFYTEHFIATLLKSAITCMGAMKWFMGQEFASLPMMMFAAVFYIIGAITYAIAMSSFFTNAKRGIEASLICWVLLVCFPISQDESKTTMVNVLQSLNINYAYSFFLKRAQGNSLADNKMTVDKLFDDTYEEGTAAGIYLIMIVVDACWMFALALAIDRYGGDVGTKITELIKGKERMKGGGSHDGDVILKGCIENEKVRAKAISDVELENVVKIYPTGEKAVNGLSFRAIRGQVSILLGQNGCGKSTTFSMISGVASPTQGTIRVAGVDAVRNKETARKFIGFCPQYNPLYDKLTVLEHLELVNALKDGPPAQFMAEAKYLLQAIRLADKAGTQSSKLSGGMKRKLCVCMAMIGGSKVVLLDEPTAGMDPGARKDVQLMLEKIKVNRTILLTTHYMDEAERLGDWVFVMSYGKMAASGSLNYLKKKFGSGLVLTVVLDAKSDRKHSTEIVEEICSDVVGHCKLKDQRGQMIEMTIPENRKKKVLPLLKALECIIDRKFHRKPIKHLSRKLRHKVQKLRITTLGLSLSSLETVFIRICDECDLAIMKEKNLANKRVEAEHSYERLMDMKRSNQVRGSQLQSSQLMSLFRKRYYYTSRNIYQLVFQLLIPIIIVLFAITMMTESEDHKLKGTEKLTLDLFPKSIVVMMKEGSDGAYNEKKRFIEKYSHLTVKEHSATEDHKELLKKYWKQNLGFIVKVVDNDTYIYSNPRVTRAIPILAVMATNWMMNGDEYSVTLEWIRSSVEQAQSEFLNYISAPLFVTIGCAFVTAPFVQFSIEERVCKFSHQQHLTGMSKTIFWGASVLWDSAFFMTFAGATILLFLIFNMYTNVLHLVAMMFFIFLIAILPISYVASLIFESPTKASSLLILYQAIVSTVIVMVLMLLKFASSKHLNWATSFSYSICPPSAFLFGFFKAIIHKVKEKDPDGTMSSFVEFKSLWEWKGIIRDIVFLLLASFIASVAVFSMQDRNTRVAIFDMRHSNERPIRKKPVKLAPCRAVAEEEQLVRGRGVQNCTVVVRDLVRTFGSFRAVNGLCVTVRNNECFGLLGTNGAGKTTTFDILTGLRFPSGGSAIIDGKDVMKHNYVGYCPQFDSILPDLKCVEALEIMASLHGYAEPERAVKCVLTCVGMTEHCQKNVRMCSGGQKRKISVGIAMLTRAKCIMMDEPTAGIDPRARREIWEILDWMREKSGSSIVLTSHSMEECEALCSRIAILRKGEMIALGTSQDLKSQYGNTYTMTMIVKRIDDRERVCRAVQKRMKNAVLKTAMTNITTSLVWELPKGAKDKWSKKYAKVQKLARKLKVKDFMLTQSSLEDTFINLTD